MHFPIGYHCNIPSTFQELHHFLAVPRNPLLIPEQTKPDRRTQIVHASEVSESVPGNYETAVLSLAAQLDSAGLRWRQGRPSPLASFPRQSMGSAAGAVQDRLFGQSWK